MSSLLGPLSYVYTWWSGGEACFGEQLFGDLHPPPPSKRVLHLHLGHSLTALFLSSYSEHAFFLFLLNLSPSPAFWRSWMYIVFIYIFRVPQARSSCTPHSCNLLRSESSLSYSLVSIMFGNVVLFFLAGALLPFCISSSLMRTSTLRCTVHQANILNKENNVDRKWLSVSPVVQPLEPTPQQTIFNKK